MYIPQMLSRGKQQPQEEAQGRVESHQRDVSPYVALNDPQLPSAPGISCACRGADPPRVSLPSTCPASPGVQASATKLLSKALAEHRLRKTDSQGLCTLKRFEMTNSKREIPVQAGRVARLPQFRQ